MAVALALPGCGGGSDRTNDPATAQAGANGTVALILKDSPTDDYHHIWIKISKAELLPAGGGPPVVIFEPEAPVEYDLLNLSPEDENDAGELMTHVKVQVGIYSKIRLEIATKVVFGETLQADGTSKFTRFNLSSAKIDLIPRGKLLVEAGATTVISVDIDCAKSIHESSNRINFRPVVFVDINATADFQRCPRVIHGSIAGLTYAADQQSVIGFTMSVPNNSFTIPILLDVETKKTAFIGAEGNEMGAQSLAVNDWVHVRGRLQQDGLLAGMVVVGDLDLFLGTVVEGVTNDQFSLDLYLDDTTDAQVIVLLPETLVLWSSDARLSPELIQPGMRARVIGKQQGDGSIVAVAVLPRPQFITGQLTHVEASDTGRTLTINTLPNGDTPSYTMLSLPLLAPIQVQFNGLLTPTALSKWVACEPRNVLIGLAPTREPALTATYVTVLQEQVRATVSEVYAGNRLLIMEDGTVVHVPALALIDDLSSTAPPVTLFSDITPGDQLFLHGFAQSPSSPSNATFEAAVVLIASPAMVTAE